MKNDSCPVCMQKQSLGADEGSSGVSGGRVLMIESVLCFISQHAAFFSFVLSLSSSSSCTKDDEQPDDVVIGVKIQVR